ncbi:MAG TPA: hypothetical protein VF434_13785, partial [Promineifilum sp.]
MSTASRSPRVRPIIAAVFLLTLPFLLLVFSSRPGRVSAQGDTLYIYPAQAAPGAELRISGPQFPPNTAVALFLFCENLTEVPDWPDGTADESGVLLASVVLPPMAPGLCNIQAHDVDGFIREAPLTALPEMTLELNPAAGPPGTAVDFTLTGLAPGQLTLLYDGAPVFGPQTVAGGAFGGSFVAPNDRPVPLGGEVEVVAVNQVGGQTVGQAYATFDSQAPPPPPVYSLNNVNFSLQGLQPGENFTISGMISPPPAWPLSGYYLAPVWHKPGGFVFPINNAPAQIMANGNFTIPAHLPSLLAGDPDTAEAGDELAVMLLSQNSAPADFQEAPDLGFFPSLKVKVLDGTTQLPITGAKISFLPWEGNDVSAGDLNSVTNNVLQLNPNQIGGAFGPELTPEEQWAILMAKAMCNPLPIPVNQNPLEPLELINPQLDLALLEPSLNPLVLSGTQVVNAAAGRGTTTHNQRWHYMLTIDAVQEGYGLVVGNALKAYGRAIDFDPATQSYYDAQTGAAIPNPLTVELDKPPSGVFALGKPILVGFQGTLPDPESSSNKPVFGDYYSLLNLPNTTLPNSTSTQVKIHLWPKQKNKISAAGMQLYLDGKLVDDFFFSFNTGVQCDQFKGYQGQGPAFYEGTATLPNLHLLPPGNHTVRMAGKTLGGQSFEFLYGLRVAGLPSIWFSNPALGQRTATWFPHEVEVRANWLSAANNTQVLNTDASDAETKETGPLYNRTQPTAGFLFEANANGYSGASAGAGLKGQAINKAGACHQFGMTAPGCPALARSADDQVFTYGPVTENVVPQVTYNIPGFTAGIPLVAQVVAGGSIKYEGNVTYQGQITVKDDLSVESEITIIPAATIIGGVWIHDYIGAGVLHTGKVELDVGLEVGMPITYNTNTGTDTGDMCFRYFSELYWYSGEICDPTGDLEIFGGGCAVEDTDTETLFNGYKPSGCTLPPTATRQAAPEPGPALMGTDLDSNGFGSMMAVWQASPEAIGAALYDGQAWSQPVNIPAGNGAHNPQVAFIDTDEAVAVWPQTDLTDGQLPGLTVEEAIKARHIAAAHWNGTGWSMMPDLTAPTLGEGGLALAGCPAWKPECDESSLSAVAVWERILNADFSQRDIRLYT